MSRRFLKLLFLLVFIYPMMASASWKPQSSVSLYAGAAVNSALQSLIEYDAPGFSSNFLFVLAFRQRLLKWEQWAAMGFEFQYAQHSDLPNINEWNSAFVLEWLPLPWDPVLESSFSFGNGLSYSRTQDNPSSEPQMNPFYFLFLEFRFDLDREGQWGALLRIHHRSGVFGLLDDPDIGSNYLCLGLNYLL